MEGKIIRMEKCSEKRKHRAVINVQKAMLREKYGEHVSKGTMQKPSDMAEIRLNKYFTKVEAKVKLKEAIERQKKHAIKIKKKREEETLDLQVNKLNSEDEKDMKNKERTLESLKKTI